jgi:thiol-disulfide isomerase/thioredoxin
MHQRLAVLLATVLSVPALAGPEEKIDLKVVKYDGLCSIIGGFKGKVVVVDVWANWCQPCKANFPHLVDMHRKFAKDGLVAVSVSLDEPPQREAALRFLQSQGAHFTNLLLDVDQETWQEKFHAFGPPLVFVFDKDGKWRQFKYEKGYAEAEKYVQELMHAK